MGTETRGGRSATLFTLKPKQQRLPVPKNLPPEEAKIWREIEGAMPAGFFNDANAFLLRALCSHSATANMLAAEVAKACDNNDMVNLNRLSDMHARESRAVGDLSTKLKLTHRSRETPQKSAHRQRLNSSVRPWAEPKR
jgi:hypothetical protein